MIGPSPASPVGAVLARLDAVRRNGAGWSARCPAHDDAVPSLSVSEGRDGRVLLHCHAGCTPEAVLAALDMTPADLFPAPATKDTDRPEIVATYRYADESGNLLFEVVRLHPKTFRQRVPDGRGGWAWRLGDVRRVLYRLPDVVRAVREGRTVYIVEGEKDADRLAGLGLCATTAPGGAGKWRPEYSETLRGARVVILPDNDEPGRAHAEMVARALRAVSADVRVVHLPGLPEKGDVSDWLDAGGTVEELERLVCEAPAPDTPARPALLIRSLIEILEDPAALEPPEPVVPRLAWAGRVTLLAAREKTGKSTLATAAAASVSHGASFVGEPCARGKVLWIGLEEHTGDLASRFVDFQADAEQIFVLDRLNDPLADVAAAVEQVRPRLVVLDTLPAFAALVGESPEPGSSTDWTPIMTALARPARDCNAAMLILHHARKSDGQYRDSTAIGANVDMILEMSEGDGDIRKIKARGRWHVGDYAVQLVGAQFELVSGELSVDAQVLLYVERNPECSTRDVRANVRGRRANEIDAAIRRLLEAGALVDVGDARGRRLKVCPEACPGRVPGVFERRAA